MIVVVSARTVRSEVVPVVVPMAAKYAIRVHIAEVGEGVFELQTSTHCTTKIKTVFWQSMFMTSELRVLGPKI